MRTAILNLPFMLASSWMGIPIVSAGERRPRGLFGKETTMITMFVIGMLALSIGLRAIGFAMRCLGGVMRLFFGLFGILLMPLCLFFSLAWGLGSIVLPILGIMFVLQLILPEQTV